MDNSSFEDLGLLYSESIAEEKESQYNDDSATVTARGASPPQSPIYDPIGWDMAQLSPMGTDFFSSDRRGSRNRNESTFNAVHMHVQDNARIPNYNHPVDRSNSSTNQTFPRINYKADALFSSKMEQDNSMAEIFLNSESNYRKSLNQAYEVLGSLSTEDSTTQKEIDELAAVSVDPTPWSEIKNKIDKEEEREKQQQQQQGQRHHQEQEKVSVTTLDTVAKTSEPTQVPDVHPHQSSYYPYGRNDQLPIPEKSPSPETSQNTPSTIANTNDQNVSRMAEAIATAAAIARTKSDTAVTFGNSRNDLPPKGTNLASGENPSTMLSTSEAKQNNIEFNNAYTHQSGPPEGTISKVRLQSKVLQNHSAGGGKVATSNRHLQRQRAPPHAAAHSIIRASVVAATNRKSQYGFGGNHVVPSVPAPPSIRSSSQPILGQKPMRKAKPKSKKASNTSSIKPQILATRPQLAIPNGRNPSLYVESNSGSAYERKKQKAKDARVKLNESIERLAIAVSLAGSQSKHRIDQLQNQIVTTDSRQKSIEVNLEGIKLAENAKKWDRPSFVGTAASIIQSLNAQCEALMAELIAIQQMLDSSKSCDEIDKMDKKVNLEGSTLRNTSKFHLAHKRYQDSAGLMEISQSPSKRLCLGIKESEKFTSNDEVIFGSIAKMLDPVSLCRCACTSKLWREMNAFKDEKIWLDLAVKRFGFYNVRKWSENLKDGDSEEISNKHLYEEMNASNVMPHFSQEGLSYLGNGRIHGKVSGWVFVVQRSNGETLRSVKREPSSGISGGVGYQSRPVVELRIVIQNTGMTAQPVILKAQKVGVDVSTRRRGGELEEIYWDDRFKKVVRNLDGTIRTSSTKATESIPQQDFCRLELFETAVIEVYINARGCSTISKFRQRSNFTKLLATLNGTTVPMVIPFFKHNGIV